MGSDGGIGAFFDDLLVKCQFGKTHFQFQVGIKSVKSEILVKSISTD